MLKWVRFHSHMSISNHDILSRNPLYPTVLRKNKKNSSLPPESFVILASPAFMIV